MIILGEQADVIARHRRPIDYVDRRPQLTDGQVRQRR